MTDMHLQDTVALGWDSNIRDFFITSYAHSLMASPSLWEEIAGYLLSCGHTGRAMLSEVKTKAQSNTNENANTFSSEWLTLFFFVVVVIAVDLSRPSGVFIESTQSPEVLQGQQPRRFFTVHQQGMDQVTTLGTCNLKRANPDFMICVLCLK